MLIVFLAIFAQFALLSHNELGENEKPITMGEFLYFIIDNGLLPGETAFMKYVQMHDKVD